MSYDNEQAYLEKKKAERKASEEKWGAAAEQALEGIRLAVLDRLKEVEMGLDPTQAPAVAPAEPLGYTASVENKEGSDVGWRSATIPATRRLVLTISVPAKVASDGIEDPALASIAVVVARLVHPRGYGMYIEPYDGFVVEVEHRYRDEGGRSHNSHTFRKINSKRSGEISRLMFDEALRKIRENRRARLERRRQDTRRDDVKHLRETYGEALHRVSGLSPTWAEIIEHPSTNEGLMLRVVGNRKQIERVLKAIKAGADVKEFLGEEGLR